MCPNDRDIIYHTELCEPRENYRGTAGPEKYVVVVIDIMR